MARGVGQPLGGNYLMFGFEGEGILEDGDDDLAYLDEPAPRAPEARTADTIAWSPPLFEVAPESRTGR